MTTYVKQLAKLLIRITITVGLLLWVFSRVDIVKLGETVKNAQWRFLWVVWALAIVTYLMLSIKMRLILKKQDCHASIGTLFGVSTITALYSMILPGFFDASVKWYILRQQTGKGSNVFSSMVYNQFTTLLLTSVSALAALIVNNPAHNWQLPAICLALLVFLIAVCLSLLNRTIGPKLINYLSRLIKPLPESFRNTGYRIIEQLSVFQTAPWSFHFKAISLDFVSIIVFGTTIYIFAAKAAGIVDVPVGLFIWLCAVIFILGRLPISIANLGVRETTLIGILALHDVDASSAFLMSMIIFSNRVLLAIIGAFFQLYWVFQKPRKIPRA